MRVEFTKLAAADLRQIALFIAGDSPVRAIEFVDELESAARGLQNMPERFPELFGSGDSAVRRRVYKAYSIFYRIEPNRVVILRIVHGAAVSDDFLDDLSFAP